MRIARTIEDAREALEHDGRGTVALVPTMGAFHDGHRALFRAARTAADYVVVSLFVNSPQFHDASDLEAYPRDEARDADVAAAAGADLLFAPSATEMYPPGYETWVDVERLGAVLEGAHRPGHFRGVATVCLKLFNIIRPQLAFFGQKDAQQLAVVKRVVKDLNLNVEIRPVPTVRDEDGLALSSRNVRLSAEERRRALALPRALKTKDPSRARELLQEVNVDYVEVAEFEPRVLVGAIRVGDVRLIDNVALEGDDEEGDDE